MKAQPSLTTGVLPTVMDFSGGKPGDSVSGAKLYEYRGKVIAGFELKGIEMMCLPQVLCSHVDVCQWATVTRFEKRGENDLPEISVRVELLIDSEDLSKQHFLIIMNFKQERAKMKRDASLTSLFQKARVHSCDN